MDGLVRWVFLFHQTDQFDYNIGLSSTVEVHGGYKLPSIYIELANFASTLSWFPTLEDCWCHKLHVVVAQVHQMSLSPTYLYTYCYPHNKWIKVTFHTTSEIWLESVDADKPSSSDLTLINVTSSFFLLSSVFFPSPDQPTWTNMFQWSSTTWEPSHQTFISKLEEKTAWLVTKLQRQQHIQFLTHAETSTPTSYHHKPTPNTTPCDRPSCVFITRAMVPQLLVLQLLNLVTMLLQLARVAMLSHPLLSALIKRPFHVTMVWVSLKAILLAHWGEWIASAGHNASNSPNSHPIGAVAQLVARGTFILTHHYYRVIY